MSIMVSVMEFDGNRELCDGGPRFDAATLVGANSHAAETATVHGVRNDGDNDDHEHDDDNNAKPDGDDGDDGAAAATATTTDEAAKRAATNETKDALRLELAEKGAKDDVSGVVDGGDKSGMMSPKSPMSNSSKTGTKTAVNSTGQPGAQIIGVQKEIIEDRKALRDALYQGIFHRHRRTIFAMGSFIRMLKSRNSQYNTIRSASDGEDETR